MKITATFLFLFIFLSFYSLSIEIVEKADFLNPSIQETDLQKQKLNQHSKKPKTEKDKSKKEAIIRGKNAKKRDKQNENEQFFSAEEEPAEFTTRFPSLARLDSKVLKELGTPLVFPKGFSSEVWLKCNPVYGALLWKNKVIENWLFIFKKSFLDKDGSKTKQIQDFFSEIRFHELIINKECSKRKLGCLAGHFFLYEQGKFENFIELSREIKEHCKKDFSPEMLKALFIQEDQNNIKIKHFLPSLISTFVYAASKGYSDPQKAANYLKEYRSEFETTIKRRFKNYFSYESLIDQNLADDSPEEIWAFKDAFYALCESFIGSQVPTGLEFTQELNYKGKSWANCGEIAFTNWMIGSAYNPGNHKFEPEKVTSNEVISNLMRQTNGFDSIFDQSTVCGILQNVPFVAYKQIKSDAKGKPFYSSVIVSHSF